MISSRSALVLLSCLSCLGFIRSASGEQLKDYDTTIGNVPIVKTTTNNLFVDSSVGMMIAQASSPKPSEKPTLEQILPELNLNKQTPAANRKKVSKASKPKFHWPLWWIGSGAILVIVAGGLLYVLRNTGAGSEPLMLKGSSDPESLEGEQGENVSSEVAESDSLNHHLNVDLDDNSNISQFREIEYPEELMSPSQVNTNGAGNDIIPLLDKNEQVTEVKESHSADVNNDGSDVSTAKKNKRFFRRRQKEEKNLNSDRENIPPVAENIQPPDSTPQLQQSEALEVQEPTRLPKINIVDELIKELQSPDPTKRRKAIWELAQRGDSRAMQPLVDLLIDADSKQRSLILEALSQIGNRTLKPMNRALAISLEDENAEVRKNAIRDVTRIYDMMAQISQLLRHAVDDPDAEVQETARWALTQLSRMRGLSGVDNFSPRSSYKNPPEN